MKILDEALWAQVLTLPPPAVTVRAFVLGETQLPGFGPKRVWQTSLSRPHWHIPPRFQRCYSETQLRERQPVAELRVQGSVPGGKGEGVLKTVMLQEGSGVGAVIAGVAVAGP